MRKVTSFPAQRLNLNKIGVLDIGYIADIVVFDMEEIEDRATYLNPRQYPKGINWVIVNGRKVMEEGRHLGVKSGRVLKRAM